MAANAKGMKRIAKPKAKPAKAKRPASSMRAYVRTRSY